MSSEKRRTASNTIDSDVPPLNRSWPAKPGIANMRPKSQPTQKSFSRINSAEPSRAAASVISRLRSSGRCTAKCRVG